MAWLSELKHALRARVQRPDRWPAAGLTALYGTGAPSRAATILNISSGGIFLGTDEYLSVGDLVSIKLKLEVDPALREEMQITLHAKVVRQDESGVGFMFVPPAGLDPALWAVLLRGTVVLADPERVVQVFSTLRTVLFLCRLCPSGAEDVILLLDGRLDGNRTDTLFKIVRAAENRLAAESNADSMRIHPTLVANLLRDGSWAASDLTTQLWTGLLVASCSPAEPDDSNQILVDLLVHVTPHQALIFTHACERALAAAPQANHTAPPPVILTPDEIRKLTGIPDLARNATDLAYLFNLGLIRNLFDFTSYREIDSFDISPSSLGLALYSCCQGRRDKIDPQLAAAAREHLAAFLPPPAIHVFYPPSAPDHPPQEN